MELRLIEFRNPSKLLRDMTCCDSGIIEGIQCNDCDPVFEVCVSNKEEITGVTDCNVGHFKTQEYSNTNNVVFERFLGRNLVNPLKMNDNVWNGYTNLRFTVHETDLFKNEKVNINDFNVRADLTIAANSTASKDIIMPALIGPQYSELRYAIRLYCDNFYYGSNCTKFCKPADNDVIGHFTCDEQGNKVCKDGYFGLDCKSQKPHPEYIMELRLIEFRNPSKKLEDGSCCDGGMFGKCRDCDTMVKVCVSDREDITGVLDCNVGHFETEVYANTNSVVFGHILGRNLVNPLKMRVHNQNSYVTLRFTVLDQDSFGFDIINVFVKGVELKVVGNSTPSKELTMPILVGLQQSELKYAIHTYCVNFCQ